MSRATQSTTVLPKGNQADIIHALECALFNVKRRWWRGALNDLRVAHGMLKAKVARRPWRGEMP